MITRSRLDRRTEAALSRWLVVVLLLSAFTALAPAETLLLETAADESVRVMSFNIRYDNPQDGANGWAQRRDAVAQIIAARADVAGLQEALSGQVEDLAARLPGFAWVGVGRDDGAAAGEFSPVFYRTERFVAIAKGTFWLSPTPDKPGSVGWDAALPRICTWVILVERAGGREYAIFNTHFDHLGATARRESALMLVPRIRQVAGKRPLLLTGDFNCGVDSMPYALIVKSGLTDARSLAAHASGPTFSFHEFTGKGVPGSRIDFIFRDRSWRVLEHAVIDQPMADGRFPSDHFPVVATLEPDPEATR